MHYAKHVKIGLVSALLIAASLPFCKVAAADELDVDYSCQYMVSGYRKVLGAQSQLLKATPDESGDLPKALEDTGVVLSDIMDALVYAKCSLPTNLDTPAADVSLVVGGSLTEINKCPHRFYVQRYVTDAVNVMKAASPDFDGHRAAAILETDALLKEINADLKAVNYCGN